MSYVQEREAILKAQFAVEMAWLKLVSMWEEIGKAMAAKRDADYYTGRYNEIRSKYIKRGRVAKSAAAA